VGGTGTATSLALVAGIAGSVQVAVMGRFGERIGELEAIAFAFLVTALLGAVILLLARRGLGGYGDALASPKWLWLGGVMGVLIVFAITFAGPRVGTTATVALLIAGQLVAASVIDRLGWFGVERITLGWARVAGLVLLVVGAGLTLRK
jgi:transporter family-2 protein